jgi:hypothetical protein
MSQLYIGYDVRWSEAESNTMSLDSMKRLLLSLTHLFELRDKLHLVRSQQATCLRPHPKNPFM